MRPDQQGRTQVEAKVRALCVLTAVAFVTSMATLPYVRFSMGFLVYVAVLSVAFVLLTWNRTQAWFTFWGAVLPGSTLAWAARTFHDNPPIFSLAGLHILTLYVAVFGMIGLISHHLHRRVRLTSRRLHHPDGG